MPPITPQQTTLNANQPGNVQMLIGTLLRAGVLISALLVFGGGLAYLWQHGLQPVTLQTFHGEPAYLTHIPAIALNALHGDSQAIIQAGLLVLIFTPIARVVLSVVAFTLEKDRLYVCITLIVLALLLYGLLGGVSL